jgi:hypothetical protein
MGGPGDGTASSPSRTHSSTRRSDSEKRTRTIGSPWRVLRIARGGFPSRRTARGVPGGLSRSAVAPAEEGLGYSLPCPSCPTRQLRVACSRFHSRRERDPPGRLGLPGAFMWRTPYYGPVGMPWPNGQGIEPGPCLIATSNPAVRSQSLTRRTRSTTRCTAVASPRPDASVGGRDLTDRRAPAPPGKSGPPWPVGTWMCAHRFRVHSNNLIAEIIA